MKGLCNIKVSRLGGQFHTGEYDTVLNTSLVVQQLQSTKKCTFWSNLCAKPGLEPPAKRIRGFQVRTVLWTQFQLF